ncbi:RidA family protein [Pigmentiphaga soli]
MQEIVVEGLPDPPRFGSPTALAIRAGQQIFISGTLAWDADRKLVGVGDVEVQTRHILDAMAAILRTQGASLRDIVKINFFLTDIRDKERIWAVRREMFGDHRPASTLVEVSQLVDTEAKLEVEAIALVPPSRP